MGFEPAPRSQLPLAPLPLPALLRPAWATGFGGFFSPTIFWYFSPRQKLTFFNSTLNTSGLVPEGDALPIPGAHRPGVVTKAGLILFGNDDKMVRARLWVTCLLKATHAPVLGLRPHRKTLGSSGENGKNQTQGGTLTLICP